MVVWECIIDKGKRFSCDPGKAIYEKYKIIRIYNIWKIRSWVGRISDHNHFVKYGSRWHRESLTPIVKEYIIQTLNKYFHK